MYVLYITCTDCGCREVDEVKEERLMYEGNMTDVKERETNEGRQTRLVNLCRHLHISVMDKLARRRANDRIRCAKQRGGPREGVFSSLH